MPISSTKINPLIDVVGEEELKAYVIQKSTELETDYSLRIDGIKNETNTGFTSAGYNNLRDFYEGNQWKFVKDDGTPMRVYNYCRATVINYQAFLSNEPPDIDVPPRDETDDLEIARVDQVEKLVEAILDDNKFPIVFASGVLNQSLLGDAFIFGPYIEWLQVQGEEEKQPRIRFVNIKRIENVRIIWADENYEEMTGFIIEYRIGRDKAEQIFRDQMKKRGISRLETGNVTRNIRRGDTQKEMEMVNVKYYWGPVYMLAMIGDKILDFVKHDWGFVPGQYIKNLDHPTLPWGVSDIEDILDPQQEYNEASSATRGKINQVAVPHIFYAGEGEPIEYKAGQAQMIKLGPDDRLFPDPTGQSTAPFDQYLQTRRGDITSLSQISEIFFGATGVARATGRALSVLLTGVNNRVKQKQVRWRDALESLIGNVLRLVEIYEPKSLSLIQGHYKVDVFFPSVLIRNVTEEINKFNMKLQSLETTQKNIGVPSPKDEQKKMKKEWEDTELMLEISRNPQLRLQLQQIMAQQIAQTLQGMPTGPTLDEGENEEGGQPAATEGVPQQSPVSPAGAVAQEGFRQAE